jgi:hypothetical protein
MRKFFLTLLLGLMFVGIAHAQDTKPRTASGDKALMFSITGLGTFGIGGSYAGTLPVTLAGFDTAFDDFGIRVAAPLYGFGMKFYLGDNVALRAAIGGGTSTVSTPRAGDSTGKTDDVHDVYFGVAPALEFHIVNAGPVSVYTGATVNFSTTVHSSGDEADTIAYKKRSYSTFGGSAILGVEYFPFSALSLGAEYQLGVASTSSSSTAGKKESDGKSYLDIGISTLAVSLGVYF